MTDATSRRTSEHRLGWSTLLVLGLSALVVAGCSSNSEPSSSATPTTTVVAITAEEAEHDSVLVRHLQEELNHLGYRSGHVDGVWGEQTSNALRAFQSESGLEATGHLDAETATILADTASGTKAFTVEALQQKLAELGFYAGTVDGDFGEGTEEAVKGFQAAQVLDETGVLDHDTFIAITYEHATTVEQEHIDAALANGIGGVEFLPAAGAQVPDDYLKQGSEGPEVQELQERLAELGYRPGDASGRFDADTASAVLAFQKAEGLQRDSIVGPEVEVHLADPEGAGPKKTDAGPRVEVDLDRQIMFVIDASGNVTTINVSTGSGREFQSAEEGKGIVLAHTPIGEFEVIRSIDGNREAPLGTLYRPLYFDGGWAIHGNPHVPGYPASHGCVRTANWDQDFVWTVIDVGDGVWIYGKNPDLPPNAGAGA